MTSIAAGTTPVTPLRSRRKSAKAAREIVAAALKREAAAETVPDAEPEEEYVPEPPKARPPAPKRSYSRASSQGSVASAASHGSLHGTNHAPKNMPKGGNPNSRNQHHNKKKTALSSYAVEYLKAWMMSPNHIEHPYPTEDEKGRIMSDTGIELKQLTNWFVNNRKRYWKPKVEEMRRKMNNASGLGRSLQEMAALEQARHGGSIPAAAAAALANNSGLVSASEDESASSKKASQSPSNGSNGKKRKYSTKAALEPPAPPPSKFAPSQATNTRSAKKAKQAAAQAAVADPMIAAAMHANGIATATTHETVKKARKMSHESARSMGKAATRRGSSMRVISETSSNEESEESDAEAMLTSNPLVTSAGVSNPLGTPVLTSVPSTGVPPPASTVAVPAVDNVSAQLQAVPLTSDLDYSITPLDSELALENTTTMAIESLNTIANTATAAAAPATAAVVQQATEANVICCGGVVPHSCNLADPNSKNRNAQPCALCSACRDWNLGEFCPWDLTGIIGDISQDQGIPDPSSIESTASAGSGEEVATTVTKASTIEEPSMDEALGVPKEISHSTSAADFLSSMADIENWD